MLSIDFFAVFVCSFTILTTEKFTLGTSFILLGHAAAWFSVAMPVYLRRMRFPALTKLAPYSAAASEPNDFDAVIPETSVAGTVQRPQRLRHLFPESWIWTGANFSSRFARPE